MSMFHKTYDTKHLAKHLLAFEEEIRKHPPPPVATPNDQAHLASIENQLLDHVYAMRVLLGL